MDYILRDSQKLGIQNNTEFDIIVVLTNTTIINDVWCFNMKDYSFIYDLICQRFVLYSRYYLNNEATIFAHMITNSIRLANIHEKFLNCINNFENIICLKEFCQLTDEYIENLILNKQEVYLLEAKKIMIKVMKCEIAYKYIAEFLITKNDEIINQLNQNEIQTNQLNQNEIQTNQLNQNEIQTNQLNQNEIQTNQLNQNKKQNKSLNEKLKNNLVTNQLNKTNTYIDNKIISDKSNPDNMINNIKFHINNNIINVNDIKGLRTLYRKMRI
jgi:HD superfamily phosphohydrolase